jgi:hypothetical protein
LLAGRAQGQNLGDAAATAAAAAEAAGVTFEFGEALGTCLSLGVFADRVIMQRA